MTRQTLPAIVLGVLLVFGTAVVPASLAVASSAAAADARDATRAIQDTDAGNVTVMDAMVAAQNETNGTAIGVEIERHNETPVYEVEVLRADGTRFEVDVNAETGAILDTESGGLIGGDPSEGILPANRTEPVTEMRSAIEAVRVVQNRTVTVSSITRVDLEVENSTLVYEVTYSKSDGTTTDVLVPAVPDQNSTRTG